MKKIESIEEMCLSILAESEDPWVPFHILLERYREISGDDSINESLILSFLKNHSEIKVFDNFYINIPEMKNIIEEKELKFQPYVILKRRLPNEKDMYIWMYNHLKRLLVMLEKMENNARYETKNQQIGIVINKARDLLEKLKSLTVGKKEPE